MNTNYSEDDKIIQTKTKRDHYLLQIRKNKSFQVIKNKRRLVITNPDENGNENNSMIDNQGNEDNGKFQNDTTFLRKTFYDLEKDLRAGIEKGDYNGEVLDTIILIQKKVSANENPDIDGLLNSGLLGYLTKFLDEAFDQYSEIQYHVLWSLANCFSGEPDKTKRIVNPEDHSPLNSIFRFFFHADSSFQDTAIWAISNVAGDTTEMKAMLYECNIVAMISKFFHLNKVIPDGVLVQITWLLSNLANDPNNCLQLEPLFPFLDAFLNSKDEQILGNVCWAFAHLTQNDDFLEHHLRLETMIRLMSMINKSDFNIKAPALRCIGNASTGPDKFTNAMLQKNVLQMLLPLLNHNKLALVREALWVLGNFLAHNEDVVEKSIELGVLGQLRIKLFSGPNDIKSETIICYKNALEKGFIEHKQCIIDYGLIEGISFSLESNSTAVLLKSMQLLDTVLQIGDTIMNEEGNDRNQFLEDSLKHGILSKIDELQYQKDTRIYNAATHLIDNHFQEFVQAS